ncbi:hypothetical protein RR46_10592 [Papilio xuthus]|uniref:Uncharacterized protein n=1 Tax=Papilio xuthus TaxID=66420 RepID=A0A194PJ33_PAPXU|nr:hypothetical protein RR46_10592 [Papilio xuthus]
MAKNASTSGLESQTPTPQQQQKPTPSKPKKKPFQWPKNKTQKIIPKPNQPSTRKTPLTNDPLWLESFVIDGETASCGRTQHGNLLSMQQATSNWLKQNTKQSPT